MNGDGYDDLVIHISDFNVDSGATIATLTGSTYGGTQIAGSDTINIVAAY